MGSQREFSPLWRSRAESSPPSFLPATLWHREIACLAEAEEAEQKDEWPV